MAIATIKEIDYNEFAAFSTIEVASVDHEVKFYRPAHPSQIGQDLEEGWAIRLDVGDDQNSEFSDWLDDAGLDMSDLKFSSEDEDKIIRALEGNERMASLFA